MHGPDELTLPPEPASVARARQAIRHALRRSTDADMRHAAELVVSELVTNAVVHAGTKVRLRIVAEHASVHVEIEDGSAHLPVRRTWSQTAGTGRGLLIVDQNVDRWSATRTPHGKVVWFEIGDPTVPTPLGPVGPAVDPGELVQVTLVDVPLLMHWAWQEHATTLLREFLLASLDDDPAVLDEHAAASDALSILSEQLPAPQLPSDPDALMASSVEPAVTADKVVLKVPVTSVRHFEIASELVARAVEAARKGLLLGPPTQPEMQEMREWLCGEIVKQARGAKPTPWRAQTDVRVPVDTEAPQASVARELAGSGEPLVVTDEASVIVAVTPSVVAFLGYQDESELLGRRVLVVVPTRFHQAHIAGTTLHVTNGRDVLLDLWIDVPVVRADGSEVVVGLNVQPQRIAGGHKLFVAQLRLPSSADSDV